MVKGLSALLLAACLLLAPAPLISCSDTTVAMSHLVDAPSDMDLVFNQVALPTYKLLVKEGEAEWSGSAVAIDRFTLVTAAHVVTDMANQPVSDAATLVFARLGNVKYIAQAKVKALLVKFDLAIITVSVPLPYIAKVASLSDLPRMVRWGERVWVSGHALGVDLPVVTDGRINDLNDDGKWLRYTAPQIYGNSGGPVYAFDPACGHFKLVSIAKAGYVSGVSMVTHMRLGCNSFTLLRFIKENS